MVIRLLLVASLACVPALSQTSDKADAVAVVQKLFDAMAAHDAGMIRSTVLPDARFYYLRADAAPGSTTAEDFVTHITATKGGLLERFTAEPTVLIRGRIAQVWGEYEFLLDGKFHHCGIDSASLLKTAEGWKIASIAYTSETTGCPGH